MHYILYGGDFHGVLNFILCADAQGYVPENVVAASLSQKIN